MKGQRRMTLEDAKGSFEMEVYKVKNYKVFAKQLEEKTGCDILIRLMGKDHTHYQFNKMGLSLGVLCIDHGNASFAPFVTLDTAKNDQYINAENLPLFDDFVMLMKTFREMFVDDSEEIV